VVLERAVVPARIVVSTNGRIAGLFFGPAVPITAAASVEAALKQFAELPGNVSLVVMEAGRPRGAFHADDALAVGSAFKLAILESLRQKIVAGKHRWEEVVPLRSSWKSVPSGALRTWPDNTPLTLATLANEMVSVSDNTAADALLDICGRGNVEAVTPRNRPFLSTREAFVLKANSDLLRRFRAADEAGKRALLPESAQRPLPDPQAFGSTPLAPDVEWFFTANELCALMAKVEELPAMHINPGLANAANWKQVAFKGGSEPGVLNMTTGLIGRNGKRYCIAATWNNSTPLDDTRFFGLYAGVLSVLERESAR
jgi:beta-lactamase class A